MLSRNIVFRPNSSRVTVWCHLLAITMDKENVMLDAAKCPQGVVRTGLWNSCQHQVLIRTTRQTLLYSHSECMLSISEEGKIKASC